MYQQPSRKQDKEIPTLKATIGSLNWQIPIILRIIVGLAFVIGAYFGFNYLFDLIIVSEIISMKIYTAQFFIRFARYSLVFTVLALGAPLLFNRVKIFSRKRKSVPEDEIENKGKSVTN